MRFVEAGKDCGGGGVDGKEGAVDAVRVLMISAVGADGAAWDI